MIIGGPKMKPSRPARKRIDVSVGESVRILRELQGYSQNELAKLTGVPSWVVGHFQIDRLPNGRCVAVSHRY